MSPRVFPLINNSAKINHHAVNALKDRSQLILPPSPTPQAIIPRVSFYALSLPLGLVHICTYARTPERERARVWRINFNERFAQRVRQYRDHARAPAGGRSLQIDGQLLRCEESVRGIVHLIHVKTPPGQQIGTLHSRSALMFYKFRLSPRDAGDTL